MKAVWSRGHASVRDVYEDLLQKRKIAYTTVMTMMKVLERKGHLKRRAKADARSFDYRPTKPQRQVIGSMVREFVHRVFDGAAQPLRLHLVKHERLTEQERGELRRLIGESDEDDDGGVAARADTTGE